MAVDRTPVEGDFAEVFPEFPVEQINVDAIQFPFIYAPREDFKGELFKVARYSVTWYEGADKYQASSRNPPLISMPDPDPGYRHFPAYDWLVGVLAECDARNLSRDSIFRDCPAVLTVQRFRYCVKEPRIPSRNGVAIGLIGIKVNRARLTAGYNRAVQRILDGKQGVKT